MRRPGRIKLAIYPLAVNQLPPKLPDLDFAPKWQRLIHFLIDYSLAGVLGVLMLYGIILLAVESALAAWLVDYFLGEKPRRGWKRLLDYFLMLPYYLVFEVGFRTTPAKWLTRTTVVCADGSKPTRLRLLGRVLCRFVPLEWLSFTYEANGRGWHDTASGTYVVRRASLAAVDPGLTPSSSGT